MKLSTAFAFAAVGFASLSLGGCIVTETDDGFVIENATRFEGTTVTSDPVAYAKGQAVRIAGENGEIRVVRGAAGQVTAKFTPFTLDKKDAEDRARQEMEEKLSLTVETESDGDIVIRADRLSGASSGLGADIVVSLPDGFEGEFEINQGNGFVDADLTGGNPLSTTILNDGAGDIDVRGAGGRLSIQGEFDVTVDVASWSDQNGYVRSTDLLGNVVFRVPASVNGKITAVADESVTEENLPSSWQVAEAAPNSKSYTMGDGSGGQVDLEAGETIHIVAK